MTTINLGPFQPSHFSWAWSMYNERGDYAGGYWIHHHAHPAHPAEFTASWFGGNRPDGQREEVRFGDHASFEAARDACVAHYEANRPKLPDHGPQELYAPPAPKGGEP